MRLKTTRVKPNHCPACKEPVDAATGVEPKTKPKPDDISFCWKCGQVLLYNADLTSRIPSQRELDDIKQSQAGPTVDKLSRGIRQRLALLGMGRN
jgi:hypothetical protein